MNLMMSTLEEPIHQLLPPLSGRLVAPLESLEKHSWRKFAASRVSIELPIMSLLAGATIYLRF